MSNTKLTVNLFIYVACSVLIVAGLVLVDSRPTIGTGMLIIGSIIILANLALSYLLIDESPFDSLTDLKSKQYKRSFWDSATKRGDIRIYPMLADEDTKIDVFCIRIGEGGYIKPDRQLYAYSLTVLEGRIKALKSGQEFVELNEDDTISVDRLEEFGFRCLEPAVVLVLVTTNIKMISY